MRHSGPDRARCARSTDVPLCYMTLDFRAVTLRATFFVTRVAALLVPLASLDAAAFGEIFFSATSVHLLRFSKPHRGGSTRASSPSTGRVAVSLVTDPHVTCVTGRDVTPVTFPGRAPAGRGGPGADDRRRRTRRPRRRAPE